jgi:hypothetical protein
MAKEKYGDKVDDFLKVFAGNTDKEAKASQTRLAMCQFAAFPSHLWAGFNKKNLALNARAFKTRFALINQNKCLMFFENNFS